MIPTQLKRSIFNNIPSVYSINDININAVKTMGLFPLNDYSNPIVNVQFPLDTLPYYQTIDEMLNITDEIVSRSKVYRGTFRFMIGADDCDITTTDQHMYTTGINIYTINHNPILSIASITSGSTTFILNTDYTIINNYTQIEWIGNKPISDESFTINYTFKERGYWIVTEIASELIKWVELNFPTYLHTHGASIIQITSAQNLTEIVGVANLNIITFDVDIRYTFEWTRDVIPDDGPIMSGAALTISGSNYLEIHNIT